MWRNPIIKTVVRIHQQNIEPRFWVDETFDVLQHISCTPFFSHHFMS